MTIVDITDSYNCQRVLIAGVHHQKEKEILKYFHWLLASTDCFHFFWSCSRTQQKVSNKSNVTWRKEGAVQKYRGVGAKEPREFTLD